MKKLIITISTILLSTSVFAATDTKPVTKDIANKVDMQTFLITSDPQYPCGITNCGYSEADVEKNIYNQYTNFNTCYGTRLLTHSGSVLLSALGQYICRREWSLCLTQTS
jgi:hypothetical protein